MADSSWKFRVSGSGTVYAVSTSISSISDARLKKNIIGLSGALERIKLLKPSTWEWIDSDNGGETKGFVAQDIENVYPEFVSEDPDGYKNVGASGSEMMSELVSAIQELSAKVTALENA
jgi:hypothetical protein